jgi:OOP family OmpA-OmpF porin
MRGAFSRLIVVLGLALLAGCTHGNVFTSADNVGAASSAAAQPGASFNSNLAYEYAAFARNQQTEGDYGNADLFARKSLAASGGGNVAPENAANWSIPVGRDEIASEGTRLQAALDGGARDRAPKSAAVAQARYDCWIEESAEQETDDMAQCRTAYMQAMGELSSSTGVTQAPATPQAAPVASRQFQVYFDFDHSDLTADAKRIVEQAAAAAKQQPGTKIELVGRADLVGTDAYNLRLSERRGKTVADALAAAGVPRDSITVRAVGDREPPVSTPPGVREARNRVVDITLR